MKDLDTTIRCTLCKQYSPVHHWKCECDVLWHSCSIHRIAAETRTSLPRQTTAHRGTSSTTCGTAGPKKKRARTRLEFEDLLAHDIIREDRKRKRKDSNRSIIPGTPTVMPTTINPAFLTADLRRRLLRPLPPAAALSGPALSSR